MNNTIEQYIEPIITELNNQRVGIVEWEKPNPYYPKYLFLGTDRGILAYLDFLYHESSDDVVCDLDSITKEVRLANSDLDRPVFFVHLINNSGKIIIRFETDEQVKERLFMDNNCYAKNNDTALYKVNTEICGTYLELISKFKQIKFEKR